MKICQVLAGNEDGGLEKHTIELSYELQKNGIDVTVIAHQDFEDEFKGIDFIPLDLSKSRNNIYILWKLLKSIKDISPDIVHTQANKATAMVSKIKPFLFSKVVSTLHNYKRNLKPFYSSDFVITVSDKIGEKLDIPNKVTIYNGVKDSEHIPYIDLYNRYDIPKDKFIICSVARFTYVKRFDILLNALVGKDNIHLVLVGDGEESSKLKDLAHKLGISNQVTFTGSLSNSDVKQIVASSKLFVMSSDNEGFPYTFVESMFCKTPFISTPVSDMKKLLGDRYVVSFGDIRALSDKIDFVVSSYDIVCKDFEPIFEFAKDKFTLSNMTKETIDVYKRVLR